MSSGLARVAMLLLLLLSLLPGPAVAGEATEAPEGPRLTVPGRVARQYDLALDEVELDWSGQPAAKRQAPGQRAAGLRDAAIVERRAARAVARLERVGSIPELQARRAALQAANPGAEAHLVLYVPDRPRSEATRRLLTREVGLVLAPETEPQAVIAGLPVTAIRPVPGVPAGYVVEATGPLAALDLAEALAQRPGVTTAYPLLRRQYFKR
jgi:hypothetical protein